MKIKEYLLNKPCSIYVDTFSVTGSERCEVMMNSYDANAMVFRIRGYGVHDVYLYIILV